MDVSKLRSIMIRSPHFGTIRLRRLTLADAERVAQLVDSDIDSREFAVQLISHQLASSNLPISTIRSWPDWLLMHVTHRWMSIESVTFEEFRVSVSHYIDESVSAMNTLNFNTLAALAPPKSAIFTQSYSLFPNLSQNLATLAATMSAYGNLGGVFARPHLESTLFHDALRRTTNVINAGVSHLTLQTTSLLDLTMGSTLRALNDTSAPTLNIAFKSLFQSLSDSLKNVADIAVIRSNADLEVRFPDWFRAIQWQQMQTVEMLRSVSTNLIGQMVPLLDELTSHFGSGAQAIRDADFDFALQWMDIPFIIKLSRMAPCLRAANLTKFLTTVTRSSEFINPLLERIQKSPKLRPRYKIIMQAICAHRDGLYSLSIPVLFNQIEGIITDRLVALRLAGRKGQKVYRRDAKGSLSLDRKGKPIELPGLDAKLRLSNFQSHDNLKGISTHAEQIPHVRNSIAHGNATSYGTAKVSTQALLFLWLLVEEFSVLDGSFVAYTAAV